MNYPGHSIGIRQPMKNETPLSAAEVEVAIKLKLVIDLLEEIDTFPPRRIIRKAGTWTTTAKQQTWAPL